MGDISTVGPMGRFAGDLDLILTAITGTDPEDPFIHPLAYGDIAIDATSLRIGVLPAEALSSCSPATITSIQIAVETLVALGGHVVELSPWDSDIAVELAFALMAPDGGAKARANLEAAGAIARQLRLRNLGGIVIVDFIDMTREEHREAVLAEFRKQLARDRTRTTTSGFSALGLVEMTRKRTRESLAHMLCQPCPTCEGRGQVKTARSVCYDILREILREARQFNPREFRVVASAAVVEMLLDEESVHLAGQSEFIGKPISLSAEPGMNPEQYDIVLL
jgi:Asp-tRNA(Asn)/Glu-tRNA(Gln) amidotransferase A subunit family amidase